MADSVDIKISQDLIKPIIESKIQMAVISALGSEQTLIADMVKSYMNQKVDSSGRESSYSSDKTTRLEYLSKILLSEAIKDAIKEWSSENKAIIKEEILKYFKSKKGSSMMVDAINNGIIKSFDSMYSFNVVINPKEVR